MCYSVLPRAESGLPGPLCVTLRSPPRHLAVGFRKRVSMVQAVGGPVNSRFTGRSVIATLAVAGAAVSVMQTVIVPLLPDVPHLLNCTADEASWLITATLLANAVATPSVSRLADIYGKRRMMLLCLTLMLIGSIIGAVTTSLAAVIVARAMQGCSIALIPVGMSIMRDELPKERIPSGVALLSATLGIGSAVGLPLSGIIYSQLGWHAVFWIPAVIAAGLLVAIYRFIPESPVRTPGRFDVLGALVFGVALGAVLLAITKGGHWGWTSQATALAFATFAVLLALWVPWELRIQDPLIDLRTSARRTVLLTNVASVLAGFAMYTNLLATTQYLQIPTSSGYGFGMSVSQAGLVLMPAALAMMAMAPVAARITVLYGPRTTLIVGSLTMLIGYTQRVLVNGSAWEVVAGAIIVSAGTSLTFSSMPNIIMRSVPTSQTAAANGLNSVVRAIGTSTSSAVTAAVITTMTVTAAGLTIPSLTAFQWVFGFAALASLASALIALGIPRHGTALAARPL